MLGFDSIMQGQPSPDYARWLPILRNQLKDIDFSRIRHVLACVVMSNLMHWINGLSSILRGPCIIRARLLCRVSGINSAAL
jgi:hypothetical protein